MIEKESALVTNLSGPIVEQRRYTNPMDSFTGSHYLAKRCQKRKRIV
ncbi:hypothetical protein P4S64_07250 [Vibrio sp. M60_M31a]